MNTSTADERINRARHLHERSLDCSTCHLTSFPESVFTLRHLRHLSLRENNIETLPAAISTLRQLRTLTLSFNRITDIPDSLANLDNLETLSFANNLIHDVPTFISSLRQIQYLDFSGNHIKTIPEWLFQLPLLKECNLSKNEITDVPDQVAPLIDNGVLKIDDNPFAGELGEVAQLGQSRLVAYLKERAQSAAPEWRVKLLIVGEGGVGKTNLLRRLRGETFLPNLEPTHALEIKSLKLLHPSNKEISLDFRAWDFGGQDFYHATHQFFYSGKSIFLLVWNARENIQQSKLTSWLDRIQALAPDSPTLLIATWSDTIKPNIPISELREKYSQVVGLYPVDNESGTGISRAVDALAEIAVKLDHVGRRRPLAWGDALESVRAHSEPYTDFWRFQHLAQLSGVAEFDAFADYLCHIGEITFFPRNPIYQPELAELRDWVVLKPDWLLQHIGSVLTDQEVAANSGVLTPQQQNRIWHDCPNIVQEYLLRMMDHFDLAYRTPEPAPVRSIVVELCPEDRPSEVHPLWERAKVGGATEISLEYHFSTTIPPGLPTWFIARSHRFTNPTRHWRRGALLADEQGQHWALLQADLDGRKVSLAARGAIPQNFFALLRDCFEGTLRRFPGLLSRVERIIPCPTQGCNESFKLSNLENLLQVEDVIRCHGCRVRHGIATLLFGIHAAGSQVAAQEIRNLSTQLAQMDADNQSRHEELISHNHELVTLLQREFTELFHREQSFAESHCPSVFTLEIERSPWLIPSRFESWWSSVTGRGEDALLTIYCEQPGAWHPVKCYRVPRSTLSQGGLLPHLTKLIDVFKIAGPLIGLQYPQAKLAIEATRAVVEGWSSRSSGSEASVYLLDESRRPKHADVLTLATLRGLLGSVCPAEKDRWGDLQKVHTKQFHYLWLCQKHAGQHRIR